MSQSGMVSKLRWRLALLLTLTGWSALLSLESLVRSPGALGEPRLPARLSRQGMTLVAGTASDLARELPDGLVLIEAADYTPEQAPVRDGIQRPPSPIRLRLLALTSSGTGVHLPVEELGPILLGPGGRGRCVVLDASGDVMVEMTTAEEWQTASRNSSPGPPATLAWLAGLRPFRANLCLWESLP